jgi:hypothetical protein
MIDTMEELLPYVVFESGPTCGIVGRQASEDAAIKMADALLKQHRNHISAGLETDTGRIYSVFHLGSCVYAVVYGDNHGQQDDDDQE